MSVPQVYIFCSGKSGSSSLHETLKVHFESIHIHSDVEFRATQPYAGYSSVFELVEHSIKEYDTVYFIDVYRNPIERRISSYFQHSTLESCNYNNYIATEKDLDSQLAFIENYSSIAEVFNHFELSNFSAFDWDRGYNIKKHRNIVFIKLRFADIHLWGQYLSSIFGRQIEMVTSNLTKEKANAELYEIVRNKYKIPDVVLEYILMTDLEFKIYNKHNDQIRYFEYWLGRSKKAELPIDFDWHVYAALNRYNFVIVSHPEAAVYYLRYKTRTAYKFSIIPDDFDVKKYISLHEDLAQLNEIEARAHYEVIGFMEHRVYK
jgi:hypothetical protein